MNQIFRWFNDLFMPSPEGDNLVMSFENMVKSEDLEIGQLKALYEEGLMRFARTQKEEVRVGLNNMKDAMKLHIGNKIENKANYNTMLQNLRNDSKTIADFYAKEKELAKKVESNGDESSKNELQRHKDEFQAHFAKQLSSQLKDFSERQSEYISKQKQSYARLKESVDKIGDFDDRSIIELRNILRGLCFDQN